MNKWRKFILYCQRQRSLVRKLYESNPAQSDIEASRIEEAGRWLMRQPDLTAVLRDPSIRVKDIAIIKRNVVDFFGINFWNLINGT